jgi:hypothetical protein
MIYNGTSIDNVYINDNVDMWKKRYTTIPTTSNTPINTTVNQPLSDITCNDIFIKDKSLTEELNLIKDMLLILQRNNKMEAKYPELKEAYNNYNNILQRLKAMEALIGEKNIE